ncbi:MAG: hypothetical protein KAI81_10100, partial [Candidatus Marinimicrobia bacterium]|nr:hypothetical protein [Candidatus Neomarinimicrobiota bacterium]
QEAIYPVALIIQPSIINRAKTDQIMYMSDLNKKIPFILMDSRTEKLSRNIKKEFSNIKTIPYPFVISELVELMKKMEIPERKRPYRRRYGKRRDVNGNLKE